MSVNNSSLNIEILEHSLFIKKQISRLINSIPVKTKNIGKKPYKVLYELNRCERTNNLYLKCNFYHNTTDFPDENYTEFRDDILLSNKPLQNYTNNNKIEIYVPSLISTTYKPSCKVLHNCFVTDKEYMGETIKKYLLGFLLFSIYQKVFSYGLLNGKQTILAYLLNSNKKTKYN